MCTCVKKSEWRHPRTAKQDIEVYKKINWNKGIASSSFKSYVFTPNEINTTIMKKTAQYSGCLDSVEDIWRSKLEVPFVMIGEGFHALLSLEDLKNRLSIFTNTPAALFVIPKGTKYVKNDVGCIVSNQIIFKYILP